MQHYDEDIQRQMIICAYFFARFNDKAKELLHYKTYKEAWEDIGALLGVNPNSIKNCRDEFDPHFPNNRNGWFQRPMRSSRQEIFDKYKNISDRDVLRAVKDILHKAELKKSNIVLADSVSENILAEPKGFEVADTVGTSYEVRRSAVEVQKAALAGLMDIENFRIQVLDRYHNQCCMTGSKIKTLLEAVPIKPWNIATAIEHNDLQNSLCLNIMCGTAFKEGYLTIDKNCRVRVAEDFKKMAVSDIDRAIVYTDHRSILCSKDMLPGREYLEWHQDNVFMG